MQGTTARAKAFMQQLLNRRPEVLGAVFLATTLQTCIEHLIRNSLDFASWEDRKAHAAAIKRSTLR